MKENSVEFLKHKFDMMLLVLVIVAFLFILNHAAYFHSEGLMIWAETTLAGLTGAFINMLTNRQNTASREADSKKETKQA